MPAPTIGAGDHTGVDGEPRDRAREGAGGDLGPPGDRHEHEQQAVERPAQREPRQRGVRLVERGRGEEAHQPAAEQDDGGDDEAGGQDVIGGDPGVQALGLRIVGDRVGQRRPRVLEAAHGDDHHRRELDRQRVEAGLPRPLGVQEIGAVHDVERIGRPLRRDGGHAELEHRPQRRPRAARQPQHADPPSQRPPQTQQHERRRPVVAEQIPARAAVAHHYEHDRQRDGEHDVAARGQQVRPAPLVDAQQRVGHLQVGEGPQPEQAEVHEAMPGEDREDATAMVVVTATKSVACGQIVAAAAVLVEAQPTKPSPTPRAGGSS